jgi:hypothetical protein
MNQESYLETWRGREIFVGEEIFGFEFGFDLESF